MMSVVLTLMLLSGSEDPQISASRAETAKAAREEKARNLQKPERGFLENALFEFKERRVLERFQEGRYGFHPLVGGLAPRSGLAGGTYYEKGPVRAAAQVSVKGYQKYEVRFTAPKVFTDRFFADFRATHRDYVREPFFGIGENSRVEDLTSYRLEDTNYHGRFGVSLSKKVKAGVHGGWLDPNVRVASGGFAAPDPSYGQAGVFLEVDHRDKPGNPRDGGYYAASWTSFVDSKLARFSFDQYDVEANHYFPFLNQRRVIALRARATLTHTATGHDIPFFMQPTLGGSDDLRGFRDYRFRDRNMVAVNAEYRWEAFSGLDLALFGDAGHVAAKAGDLSLARLRTSYGLGFRFNTSRSVFLRADIGFSNEGRRVSLKFNHFF
jgi:outer membrane protein assembly factor BamA